MSILQISREEFDSLDIDRVGAFPERSWFKSSELDVAGAVILDPFDKDWSYVVLAKDEDGIYRYIQGEVSLSNQEEAETKLHSNLSKIEISESFEEQLFSEPKDSNRDGSSIVISSIDDAVKQYFKRNPEKLYELPSRKFEELIASILKDLGFEVELTQATRDGGRDIIAYVRNAVCSYLTHIECKRYAADNKVGVGIIREVVGVHQIRKATKSIIVTTSFFTSDAQEEARLMQNQLDLKDFNDVKSWLQKY
jgi:HJR/Mrr/RecB family endonuclease